MGEFLGEIFNEIRYMRFAYFALLAIAIWGALRAGPRRSAAPAIVSLLLLLLLSWPPLGWALNSALERPFPVGGPTPDDVDAVVVFSGGSFGPERGQPFTYLDSGTNLRCQTAARLYQSAGRPPVVVCGPSLLHREHATAVWDLMARQLESWGVPERRIHIEGRGRSTYEQAVHAADILRGLGVQRVAVVTEAFHMRRAAGCLARQGFETFAVPAGTRGVPTEIDWRDFVPNPGAASRTEEALREIGALLVYKLRGRI